MTDIRSTITDAEDLRMREKKMPKVRTTSSTMETFDANKIIDSLILEAGLLRVDAHLIAVRVMDRIVASGIKFLSGPLIREMCNSVLAEMGFERERVLYTRVGIPMHDLGLLINNPSAHTSNANLMRNFCFCESLSFNHHSWSIFILQYHQMIQHFLAVDSHFFKGINRCNNQTH